MPYSKVSIVLLHGFFQDSRVFESVKQRFKKKGFEVFSPDLPGYGIHTTINEEAFLTQNQVKWLVDYVISLSQENLFICGYSMGARLLLQSMNALEKYVSGFIIESGTNGIEQESERAKRIKNDTRLAQMIRTDFKSFQEFWMNHPTLTPIQPICFDDLLRLKIIQSEQVAELVALSLEHFGTATMPYLNHEYFQSIIKPVLFLAGKMDNKFAQKAVELATIQSNFQFKLIENCGHRIHLEKPSEYVEEISTFINSISN